MRADQIKRLEELQDKLVDIYLDEADPESWPENRGDRVWHKKDANLTITHVIRIKTLLDMRTANAPSVDEDLETEKMTADAMAQADAIIENARGKRFGPRAK
jgi:hypothetical protein